MRIHHIHHLSDEDRELLVAIVNKLVSISEALAMIPKEVQDLLDQSKANNDLLKSMQLHYDALAVLIGQLQTSIAGLKAGAVLSDVDKAAIVAQTGDLAAEFSSATADITANTPLEAAAAASVTGAATPNVASDLANAPRTDSSPTATANPSQVVDGNTVGSLAGTVPPDVPPPVAPPTIAPPPDDTTTPAPDTIPPPAS